MSYEIIYGKQFIDLGNNKYLPIVLMGSNNCTMFYGGREIREREWTTVFAKDLPVDKDEYLEVVEGYSHSPYEAFKETGKWVMNSDLVKWAKNCFKNARTIEEIVSLLPRQSLCLEIASYGNEDGKTVWNHFNRKYVRTTAEILEYLDAYNKMEKEEGKSYYLRTAFDGIESLGLGKKTAITGRCIVKYGKDYITDYDERSTTYSSDILKAKVFENEEEAKKAVSKINTWGRVTAKIVPYNDGTMRAKAQAKWAIKLDGYYVLGMTKRYVQRTVSTKEAKRFTTEAQAQKYADKINGKISNSYTAKVVEIGAV